LACIQCEKAGLTAEECGRKTLPVENWPREKKTIKTPTNAEVHKRVDILEEKVEGMMKVLNNLTEAMENMNRFLARLTSPSPGVEQPYFGLYFHLADF